MPSNREIADAAVAQYKLKYPNDTDVHAVDVVQDVFKGHLVVICSTEPDKHHRHQSDGGRPNDRADDANGGSKAEEIVYVNHDLMVRIFGSTAELANFLQSKASSRFVQMMTDTRFIAASTLLLLLLAIFAIGFFGKDRYDPSAFQALSGVLLAAAGFFFGTQQQVRP
jgi:hypothetical protein